jgi:hypothetical protein
MRRTLAAVVLAVIALAATPPSIVESQPQARTTPAPAVSIAPAAAATAPAASSSAIPVPVSTASGLPVPVASAAAGGPDTGTFLSAPPSKPVDLDTLKSFTGQLLDVRGGYVYFTTGDAFKIAPTARVVDFATGEATTVTPDVKMFAKATLNPHTKEIVVLAITRRRLPADTEYASIKQFAAPTSPEQPAPELAGQIRLTGRPVAVTFFVQVPPTTPLTDDVYISTDASGWQPNAYRMDRVDAIHYRLTRSFASGTKFSYKYTRGSWNSVELAKTGLQPDARQFLVREADALRKDDVVFSWSDQQPNQPNAGPNALPTPFNPLGNSGFPPNTGGEPQPNKTLAPGGLPPGCSTPGCPGTKRP